MCARSNVRAKGGRDASVMAPRRHRSGRGAAQRVAGDTRGPWRWAPRRAKGFCHARPPPRLLAPQALAD
eukprot:4490853-Prymnesium_polylepis.1